MSQKSAVDGFEWFQNTPKFNEDSIKNKKSDSDIGYLFKVDVKYPDQLYEPHKDLSLIPKRMKI